MGELEDMQEQLQREVAARQAAEKHALAVESELDGVRSAFQATEAQLLEQNNEVTRLQVCAPHAFKSLA